MSKKKANLDIYFPNESAIQSCIYYCSELLLDTVKLLKSKKGLMLTVKCENTDNSKLFKITFGEWIVKHLFTHEIIIAAQKIQSDLTEEELDLVCIGTLCVLSEELSAIQDIMGWVVTRYFENNNKMSLSTFVKMNAHSIQKDIKFCMESIEIKNYLPFFLSSIIDLRNESDPHFFRNILKQKLLTLGYSFEEDHAEILRISCKDGNLRASTNHSYVDNQSLAWITVNEDGSIMTPEQFLTFAALLYSPRKIIIYPFEAADRLKKFINDHRIFFGEVKVGLWQAKNKS